MAKIPIDKFDKFIKSKVEMHQTPVDTDQLWSNIQKTGRSKRTGILPGALLLLLVSFFVSVHLLNNSKAIQIGNLTDQATASSRNSGNMPEQKSNNIYSASLGLSSESSTIQTNNEILKSDTHSEVNFKHSEKHQSKNIKKEHASASKKLPGDNAIMSEVSGSGHISQINDPQVVEATLDLHSGNPVDDGLFTSATIEGISSIEFEVLTGLATRHITELQFESFFPQMTLFPQSFTRIQPVKHKAGFEMRVNGGIGMVTRNMELLNPEAENWMQSRKESEHQLESVRWGMDIKMNISRNVYLFAGLEDLRINERLDYSSVEKLSYKKQVLASRLIYDADSYIMEQGEIDVYEEIHRKGTFFNQIRMINIPIGIGVSQRMGRFSIGLEGAVLINAFNEFDGKMADASDALIDLKDAGMRVSQIQTARVNGVFAYQFSSRWGLNLITGADLPLKNIQLGQHMSQNYMVFQGNLGICYNW